MLQGQEIHNQVRNYNLSSSLLSSSSPQSSSTSKWSSTGLSKKHAGECPPQPLRRVQLHSSKSNWICCLKLTLITKNSDAYTQTLADGINWLPAHGSGCWPTIDKYTTTSNKQAVKQAARVFVRVGEIQINVCCIATSVRIVRWHFNKVFTSNACNSKVISQIIQGGRSRDIHTYVLH